MVKYRPKAAFQNQGEPQKQPVSIPEAEGRSILPGEGDDNAFRKIHPRYLRRMYKLEKDPTTKALIWHALKQWSRQYVESLIEPYPYMRFFEGLEDENPDGAVVRPKMVASRIAERFAEVANPARNCFYYQDAEVNQAADFGRNDGLGHNDPWVGGSEGNKDPNKWDKMVHPQQGKYEQNRPEENNHSWSGDSGGSSGDFSAPYEGQIKKNWQENDGSAGATASVKKGTNMSFFDNFVWADDNDIETFLTTKKASRKKVSKIVKLADLDGFMKVSKDLLIHKSERDLWAMETDDDGNILISRLFDKDCI